METRICKHCGLDKAIDEFYVRLSTKKGVHSYCKDCSKEKARKNAAENKERRAFVNKLYRDKNKLRLSNKKRDGHKARVEKIKNSPKKEPNEKTCPKCKKLLPISEFHKAAARISNRVTRCKACVKVAHKNWYEKNKDKIKKRNADTYKNNKEAILKRTKEYQRTEQGIIKNKIARSARKPITKELKKTRHKIRQASDRQYVIKRRLRALIHSCIGRKDKTLGSRVQLLLQCSIPDFIEHIEQSFKPGMSWENKGEWHIDHIIPCSAFDLTINEEVKMCFHYKNLRPLWSADNLSKGAKLDISAVIPDFIPEVVKNRVTKVWRSAEK